MSWKDPAKPGSPYRRSWFHSLEDARKFAGERGELVARMGSAWLEVPPEARADLMAAMQAAERAGITVRDAVAQAIAARPNGQTQSVRDLFSACIRSREVQGIRPRSLHALAGTFKRFEASGLCHLPAGSITAPQIEKYLSGLRVSQRTRAGVLINLQTGFSYGVKIGVLVRNPCAAVPRPVVEPKPTAILTPEQTENLFRVCEREDPELLGFLALSAFAGLRPESEVERMTRADVLRALEGDFLTPPVENKTRRRRLIPILPNLRAWLEAWGLLDAPVIPMNFTRRWERVRKSAGLWPWPQNVLRHSRVSYRLAATGDAAGTALEDGHSEAMMHTNYKALATAADAERFFSVLPTPGADYPAAAAAARERQASKSRGGAERMRAMAAARWARQSSPSGSS